MNAISKFLAWWEAELAVTDREPSPDHAKNLYYAYRAALSDLQDARAQTLDFLQPVNNGKAWVVGFAADKIPEVAALAGEIAKKEENLKSISNDIKTFLDLNDDAPHIREIARRREELRGAISRAARAAEAVRRREMMRNRAATMAELTANPDIVEAEKRLTVARETNEPIIAELSDKLEQMSAIVDKYPQG